MIRAVARAVISVPMLLAQLRDTSEADAKAVLTRQLGPKSHTV